MKNKDPRVDIIARAICEGLGHDPDREVILERLSYQVKRGPQWHQYRRKAYEHIAAWDALKALEAGENEERE